MTGKVRRIDFYPDEYISGVGVKLSVVDQGVYWMVCSLIYSGGEPIDDDHIWIAGLFKNTHWRTVRASIDRLILSGKIRRIDNASGAQITVKRCAEELQKVGKRIAEAQQNGRKGGRPSIKNNEIGKGEGFVGEKLTSNQQPTTSNQQDKEINKEKKNTGLATKKGKKDLAKDWKPNGRSYEVGEAEGYTRDETEWLADGMRDWAPGKQRVNWDAQFNNWQRSAISHEAINQRRQSNGSNSIRGNGVAGEQRLSSNGAVATALRFIDRHKDDKPVSQ